MRIIALGAGRVSAELAERLDLAHVRRIGDIATDGFVLDGERLHRADAVALDAELRARASEIDAVLWLRDGDPEVLDHYRGRVVSLDPDDPLESALAGLREVLLRT